MLSNEWAIWIDYSEKSKKCMYLGKEMVVLTFMILNNIIDIVPVILLFQFNKECKIISSKPDNI